MNKFLPRPEIASGIEPIQGASQTSTDITPQSIAPPVDPEEAKEQNPVEVTCTDLVPVDVAAIKRLFNADWFSRMHAEAFEMAQEGFTQ